MSSLCGSGAFSWGWWSCFFLGCGDVLGLSGFWRLFVFGMFGGWLVFGGIWRNLMDFGVAAALAKWPWVTVSLSVGGEGA